MRVGPIRPEVIQALTDLPQVRSQVRRVAAAIRDDARRRAPKDTGVLRKSIYVTTDREPGTRIRIAKVVIGAFYGRFIELGTVDQPARPFLRPAADAYRRGDVSPKPPRS